MAEQTNSFTGLGESLRHMEQRMDSRFDALDEKTSRQFAWMMGLYVATLGAVLGALLARL